MAVLLAKYLRYDFDRPAEPLNDHLVFSKGHASPLLYSMYKAAGAISDTELLSFRKLGSRLEGHPTPEIPWVDVAPSSCSARRTASTSASGCSAVAGANESRPATAASSRR